MHTDRCRFAKSSADKCKCSCKGTLHGGEKMENAKILDENIGGEAGEFIKNSMNKKYYCKNHKKIHTIKIFYGYENPRGLADKNGNKWWIYVLCVNKFQTSFNKLPDAIKQANIENEKITDWESYE